MFWKSSTLILLVILAATIGSTLAQEGVTQLGRCSDDEIEDLNTNIELYLPYFVDALNGVNIFDEVEQHTPSETLERLAKEQRSFSNVLRVQSRCIETYTIGYVLAHAVDHFTIAYGLLAAAEAERAVGNDDIANELAEDAESNRIHAEGILQNNLPEIYAEYFSQS
jgi:hypothetical protein